MGLEIPVGRAEDLPDAVQIGLAIRGTRTVVGGSRLGAPRLWGNRAPCRWGGRALCRRGGGSPLSHRSSQTDGEQGQGGRAAGRQHHFHIDLGSPVKRTNTPVGYNRVAESARFTTGVSTEPAWPPFDAI